MSEVNVTAILYPKPEKFEEVRLLPNSHAESSLSLDYSICEPRISHTYLLLLCGSQVAALAADITKKVQEHEPDTLLYYAFRVQEKNEIVVVER